MIGRNSFTAVLAFCFGWNKQFAKCFETVLVQFSVLFCWTGGITDKFLLSLCRRLASNFDTICENVNTAIVCAVRNTTIMTSPTATVTTSQPRTVSTAAQHDEHNMYMFYVSWCFYHLRQPRPVTRSLTPAAAQTVVQAFISCRLDHCNSLLYGISEKTDATRPVSSKCRRTSSHWSQTSRSHLAGATSPALASGAEADRLQAGVPCSFVTGWTSSSLPRRGYLPRRCRSRSLAPFLYGRSCSVPRTYSTSSNRSFAAAGTRVWNSLPLNLRDEKLFSELQALAENSLVYCWPQRNVNIYLLRYRNALTYLLTNIMMRVVFNANDFYIIKTVLVCSTISNPSHFQNNWPSVIG